MQQDWFKDRVERYLVDRNETGLYRSLRKVDRTAPGMIRISGRDLIDFGSNDYLGLAWHPDVLIASNSDSTWGSGASPVIAGRTTSHEKLEQQIATWKQAESALLFGSGYVANLAVVSTIAKEGDIIFSDELNHASLIDGCRLSKATVRIYSHNDVNALRVMLNQEVKLRKPRAGFWIVSDTVFSMEGDCVSIEGLIELAREFDAGLILDEAHAVGVYGRDGVGLVDQKQLSDVPAYVIGTCSKALGSIGGYVTSTHQAIDYLRQQARGYIYSTSIPAAATRATSTSIERCILMEEQRIQLRQTAADLRKAIKGIGLRTSGVDSPIVPVYFESSFAVVETSKRLSELGYFVPAIRPPTVPHDKNLLRISLSVSHTKSQIDGLVKAIQSITAAI
jgi:8-amino-7-oxononanoate synthase